MHVWYALPETVSGPALTDHMTILQDVKEPEFNTLVRIMATRCMLAAEYFCSGSVSKDAFGHYGLASPIYTHFTVSLVLEITCRRRFG